jgi:peptidoglycan/LPS O-acetylase OafA/YrhL
MQFRWTMTVLAVALLLGAWWVLMSQPASLQTPDVTAAPQTPSPSSAVGAALPGAPASAERAAVEGGTRTGDVDIDHERDLRASAPGVAASFDRARAVASVQAVAGGPAIELVLPAR